MKDTKRLWNDECGRTADDMENWRNQEIIMPTLPCMRRETARGWGADCGVSSVLSPSGATRARRIAVSKCFKSFVAVFLAPVEPRSHDRLFDDTPVGPFKQSVMLPSSSSFCLFLLLYSRAT